MVTRYCELSTLLEKSTDLPRDQFISINHELSEWADKYECYRKYLVTTAGSNDVVEDITRHFGREGTNKRRKWQRNARNAQWGVYSSLARRREGIGRGEHYFPSIKQVALHSFLHSKRRSQKLHNWGACRRRWSWSVPIHRRHYEHVQKLLFSQRLEMERAQLQLADWRRVSFVRWRFKL